MRIAPSPVIELNRLVAVAMADGPEAAYPGLAVLADPLDRYAYYHATRAELLRRAGRPSEAAAAYARALPYCQNGIERRFVQRRLAELHSARTAGGAKAASDAD